MAEGDPELKLYPYARFDKIDLRRLRAVRLAVQAGFYNENLPDVLNPPEYGGPSAICRAEQRKKNQSTGVK